MLRRTIHLTFFVSVLLCLPLAADELRLTNFNCAITPPSEWTVIKELPQQPGFIIGFSSPDGSRMLMLMRDERGPSGAMSERAVEAIERGMVRGGLPKKYGKIVEINGIRSYERLGEIQEGGAKVSALTQIIPLSGKLYTIQAMRRDGSAADDAELRKSIGTFRFLDATPKKK